ncbi:radical SAM protein [Endozoicomonas lisbonensis]|uniref:Radical SAM core domain-containing protein n=1 Tax=Endozoicomonas lisbonensis TaxID=3120522 RepID=A0ABV2SEG1_9GAMM
MSYSQPEVRELSSGYKFEHPQSEITIRLDRQGRWLSYRCGASFYRRCMGGDVVCGKGEIPLHRSDKVLLVGKIATTLDQWSQSWKGCKRVKSVLQTASGLDFNYYNHQAALYRAVYPEGVPILPPDRYGDLVVQPVTGCPNRACTFCAFYKDKPYKMLPSDRFAQHLLGVQTLLGGQCLIKDGLFIGSANAMALSQRRLMAYLQQIHSCFDPFKRGIAAFADPDFSAPRNTAQWQELANAGVTRLVIGLETGWGALRGRLGKSADLTRVCRAVHDYKRAGISVGITVLAGASEPGYQQENVQRTAAFIKALGLERKDIVYLSPLESANVDRSLRVQELRLMKKHLSICSDAQIVPYQMQRFRYYC